MKFVLYTNSVSAHQLPLARVLARRIGEDSFRYVYTGVSQNGFQDIPETEPWIARQDACGECSEWLENCETLLCGVRDLDLMERRAAKGLKTFYMSERWLKPILFERGFLRFKLPGVIKLLHPGYLRMVTRMTRLLSCSNQVVYLPIGKWAEQDMSFLYALTRMGRRIRSSSLLLWGYFVEPSSWSSARLTDLRAGQREEVVSNSRPLKVLWVGRLMALKNVDTIIRAIWRINRSGTRALLTIVGDGSESVALKRLVARLKMGDCISFAPPVTLDGVRELMRENDLYVFASNGFDGWGAVVSEALAEQMPVLASRECGAGRTLLPEECTFGCRDDQKLAALISRFETLPRMTLNGWTVDDAVARLEAKIVAGSEAC